MPVQFTYGNVILGFVGLFALTLIMLANSTIQCTDKSCEQALGQITLLGIGIALFTIIFGCFIPFFRSIKPEIDVRDKLAKESGPAHGTLPKGFDKK